MFSDLNYLADRPIKPALRAAVWLSW